MGRALLAQSPNQERRTQNFVSVVSAYSHQPGVVLAAQQFESKKSSELKVVQTMLEALQLEGVVFTLDALHCQKNY
jgi:hypothetical protein